MFTPSRRPSPIDLVFAVILGVILSGCSDSKDSPAHANENTWMIYGKVGVLGELDPLSGVTVKCAGQSTTSGSDGSYVLRNVPGGVQTISAEWPSCKPYTRSIDVGPNTRHYVFLEPAGSTVSGYVTNMLDGPIQEARVRIGALVGFTDQSGRIRIAEVPLRNDSLIVSHPRYFAYQTILSPSGLETKIDVNLQRDTVVAGRITGDCYVEETQPASTGCTSHLLLGVGVYSGTSYFGARRDIYVNFEFPAFMIDSRVTLLEGNLQLSTDNQYSLFNFQAFSVTSQWSEYSLTFNTRPTTGTLIGSGTAGSPLGPTYATILGTLGLRQLLSTYRTDGLIQGVVVQGGSTTSRGFFSSRATSNQPRVNLKIRF